MELVLAKLGAVLPKAMLPKLLPMVRGAKEVQERLKSLGYLQ